MWKRILKIFALSFAGLLVLAMAIYLMVTFIILYHAQKRAEWKKIDPPWSEQGTWISNEEDIYIVSQLMNNNSVDTSVYILINEEWCWAEISLSQVPNSAEISLEGGDIRGKITFSEKDFVMSNFEPVTEFEQSEQLKFWREHDSITFSYNEEVMGVYYILGKDKETRDPENMAGLYPGFEISPTVMVRGRTYAWKGVYDWDTSTQTQGDLPEESIYYGEIIHVEGNTPMNDCEFASVFEVSGQIYTLPSNSDKVLVCLTTDWTENTIIEFEIAE